MLNKAILVGRLTKNPEIRSTASGISVCNFTVAINRKFAKQGKERQADFINCIAFRHTADFISRNFLKGSMISVDGTIQVRTWDDNEGKRHWATEVIVNEAGFIGSKNDNPAPSNDLPDMPSELDDTEDDPDSLPF